MIAPTPRPNRRRDASHPVPSPSVVRRRQAGIRAGWNRVEATTRRAAPVITGDPSTDAMICFLQMLANGR
jgi:hypothetical protein